MNKKNYSAISDFKGTLNRENIDNPEFYNRVQYIKALVGIS